MEVMISLSDEVLDFNNIVASELTFGDLERSAFASVQRLFTSVLEKLLVQLDEALFRELAGGRYQSHQKQSVTLPTLVGEVEVCRRRYQDTETGEWLYPLDELLELDTQHQVSPGLVELTTRWAIKGVSYRDTRDRLRDLYGSQLLSPETIRQLVGRVAEKVKSREEEQLQAPEGNRPEETSPGRQAQVLFIEADGISTSLQQDAQDRMEGKVGVAHTGWQRRYAGGQSEEFKLRDKSYWVSVEEGAVFWDGFSRQLLVDYEITEETAVVINGDAAAWIPEGVHYFPHAIYNYDRYHLKRRLKRLLRHHPGLLTAGLTAADDYDPEGIVAAVAQAEAIEDDLQLQQELTAFRRFLKRHSAALQDYRQRLEQSGVDTSGYRGLGAAESNVSKFADRLKGQGRSWSRQGLWAMLKGLKARFAGELRACVQRTPQPELVDLKAVETTASEWVNYSPQRISSGVKAGRLADRSGAGGGPRSGRWRRQLSRIHPPF